jgi:outer membrane protein, adhesin transport system
MSFRSTAPSLDPPHPWPHRLRPVAAAVIVAFALAGADGAAAQSAPAPSGAVVVPDPAALVVPTLAELAGRPVLDLKDDLGAAGAFDRLGTAGVEQTVERALAGSFDVAATAARTQAQRELVDVARGGLLPKLDLRANTGRELSKPGSVIDEATGSPVSRSLHSRDDTALVFRQAVWDGPAAGEFARQRALYQAALASLGSARDQLALDAASAHLDLVQYRLQLQFARDYRIGLEKLYAFVERRSQGGGSSAAEAERVKARAINARSTVIEAQGALESALVTYRRLVGGVPEAVRTDDAGSARDLPALDAALVRAKTGNPQIVQLRETLTSIEAEERAARTKLYPKFEIEVGNFRTTNAGGRPGTTDDTRAMFVMNWNFLSGGADLAQLRAVKAREDETKFRILDVERRLDEALRVTYNTLDAVTQRAAAVRDEMISNQRVVAAFEEQLVLANRPLLDVLDAQQRLFQSRAELLRLTALQANLSLQVRRQLGGLAPAGPGFREAPPTRSEGYNIPSLPAAGRTGR